jgi:hypothetical protein
MIKFRQKQYTEAVSSESDNNSSSIKYEGGVLAPTLVAGGIGSMVYGKKKLSKAKELKSKIPNAILDAMEERLKGEKEIDRIKKSWLGLGKYLRKDKIRATQEAAEKATEREMMKVRKTSRSAKFNKIKGKAAIGLGIGAAALGAYKLNKQIKRNKED